MLWCHGLTSSMASEDDRGLWSLAEPIDRAGLALIRYDARGHGQSTGRAVAGDYDWANLALDGWALHDRLAQSTDEPWVLGGASMGAATTLHMAAQRPDSVRAMVLVIPPTAWETRRAQREIYEQAAGFIRRNGKARYVEANSRLPPLPIFAERDIRSVPDISEELLPIVLEGAAGADFPSREVVRTFSMPTLVLAWDADPGHPVSTAEQLADLLPNNIMHVATEFEQILGWSDRIADFVRSVGGAT